MKLSPYSLGKTFEAKITRKAVIDWSGDEPVIVSETEDFSVEVIACATTGKPLTDEQLLDGSIAALKKMSKEDMINMILGNLGTNDTETEITSKPDSSNEKTDTTEQNIVRRSRKKAEEAPTVEKKKKEEKLVTSNKKPETETPSKANSDKKNITTKKEEAKEDDDLLDENSFPNDAFDIDSDDDDFGDFDDDNDDDDDFGDDDL